ncbi:aminodeoxychorismate lyase [Microbulbifer sp. NBRC 101763]|uniref:aminotransferase class IV n=1 Tax=unclassified Microbulbifer TaxID=2619833 RepID=UPI0030B23454
MSKLPQFYRKGRRASELVPDSDYANGILETMRCHNGSLPLWSLHRSRLVRSSALSALLLSDIDRFIKKLAAKCSQNAAVARLRVGFVDGRECWDLAFLPLMRGLEEELGARLYPCHTRLLSSESKNLGCKFLDRSRYNAARAELPDGERLDGLIFDDSGRVIESLRCNLLARFGNTWVTPNLTRCGVHGVMLDWLSGHIRWQEQDMNIETFCEADEVVLCNSVRGVIPVVEIIGYKSWSIGPGARRLQQLIVEALW